MAIWIGLILNITQSRYSAQQNCPFVKH